MGRPHVVVFLTAFPSKLYDLAVDPGERDDLALVRPEIARALARELLHHGRPEPRNAPAPAATPPLTPDLIDRLRALGYLRDGDGGVANAP